MISGAELIEVEFVSVEKDFEIIVVFNNGLKKKSTFLHCFEILHPSFLFSETKVNSRKFLSMPLAEFNGNAALI